MNNQLLTKTISVIEKKTFQRDVARRLVISPLNYLDAIADRSFESQITEKELFGLITTYDLFLEIDSLSFNSWWEFLFEMSIGNLSRIFVLENILNNRTAYIDFYKEEENFSKAVTEFVFSLSYAYDILEEMQKNPPLEHLTKVCQISRFLAPKWSEAWLLRPQIEI
jgi:hypothetical protein